MRRASITVLTIAAALLSLLGVTTSGAAADTADVHRPVTAGWTVTPTAGVSTQALTCAAGDMCAWPVVDGSRNRCSWTNADNDWRNAPVTCSWSAQPVKAIYNNGRSTAYDGVCLYRGANYTSPEIWVPQRATATNSTGVVLRSHRWTRPSESC